MGKAGAYPVRNTTEVWNLVVRLGWSEHSSIFNGSISDEEKSFITLTKGVIIMKLFSSTLMLGQIS